MRRERGRRETYLIFPPSSDLYTPCSGPSSTSTCTTPDQTPNDDLSDLCTLFSGESCPTAVIPSEFFCIEDVFRGVGVGLRFLGRGGRAIPADILNLNLITSGPTSPSRRPSPCSSRPDQREIHPTTPTEKEDEVVHDLPAYDERDERVREEVFGKTDQCLWVGLTGRGDQGREVREGGGCFFWVGCAVGSRSGRL